MAEDMTLTAADFRALKALDTPTVCNALELVVPQRRLHGFNTQPLRCLYPDLPPIVGYARTGTIRAAEPSFRKPEDDRAMRLRWYEYVDKGPKPSVILLQDLDALPGYGSFWGEVNSHVHRGLGALGVITNGSVRDIPMNAKGFQMLAGTVMPSHAHVHVVDVGVPVSICGMSAQSGDLIHADMHGAVVVPLDAAKKVAGAAKLLARREAVIIGASKKKGFSFEKLAQAMKDSADIH
ncbi:RraA family protein [Vineibacter terrae]|uniref:RraA family protein n=1 Tax=Vineibacter terrae TaxID=2586908 RepID=UPI002E332C44|nr:RraA family protein [Vineibacter terrae]HEX2888237.1 RraA family protein [Vineibacter terrae]